MTPQRTPTHGRHRPSADRRARPCPCRPAPAEARAPGTADRRHPTRTRRSATRGPRRPAHGRRRRTGGVPGARRAQPRAPRWARPGQPRPRRRRRPGPVRPADRRRWPGRGLGPRARPTSPARKSRSRRAPRPGAQAPLGALPHVRPRDPAGRPTSRPSRAATSSSTPSPRSSNETTQIDGNIYVGRVQNVLPGMEAAFIDIGIPKNGVLYRGDVQFDHEDVESHRSGPALRIEEMLRPGQTIVCQVTKNPIGAKGARLTQEVSLPGRFVVLVPNSSAFGISKRLGDTERRRLRRITDEIRPDGHGLIVRTAAEGVSAEELRRDVDSLVAKWSEIESPRGAIQRAAPRLPRPGPRRADPARGVQQRLPRRAHRRPRPLREGPRLRAGRQPRARRPHRVLRHRDRGPAAVRALLRPRAAPQGARPQGLAALGGLAHHRAHRGADRHRRQHRQERGQVEPRRDRLPQQPGGGRRGGPPAAAPRHRRDHRHRLHRHGVEVEPRRGRRVRFATPCRATRPAPRSSTSPSSGSSR